MTRKVWVDAAINGSWSQSRQPLIPVAEKDIVADAGHEVVAASDVRAAFDDP